MLPQCYMFDTNGKGKFCIYDSENRNFLYYNQDTVKTLTDARDLEITVPSRFCMLEDSILCPVIKNKMTTAIFHREDFLGTHCPVNKEFDNPRKPYHSDRILVRDNKNLFVVGKGIPLIQTYSLIFSEVSSYDLRIIEEVANTFEQEKTNKPNSYFIVVNDAYAANGKLYILVSSKNNGKYRCNNIVVLNNENGSLFLCGFYELKGNIYSTITINENGQLVTVNSKTAAVEIYNIDY